MTDKPVVAGGSILCTSCGYMLFPRWDGQRFVAYHDEAGDCANNSKTFIVPIESLSVCPEVA